MGVKHRNTSVVDLQHIGETVDPEFIGVPLGCDREVVGGALGTQSILDVNIVGTLQSRDALVRYDAAIQPENKETSIGFMFVGSDYERFGWIVRVNPDGRVTGVFRVPL